jgi:hypothetical protein
LVPLRRRLRDHGVAPVLRALAKLRPGSEHGREVVRKARAYFTEHAARMDYPTFAARQFPIGSGAIESTCRHLVQLRAVQAGMRWRPEHLQAVLSLRALQRSGRWAAFWATRPLLRSRPQRATAGALATPMVTPAAPTAPSVPSLTAPQTPAPSLLPRPWQPRRHPWRSRPLSTTRSA